MAEVVGPEIAMQPGLDDRPVPADDGKSSFSAALAAATADASRPRISIAEIVDSLHDRAFGAVLLCFAAPNVLPVTPPGTSPVTSLPILWVAIQLLLGWRELHVPPFVARRTMSRPGLGVVIAKLTPLLQRLERIARPRMPLLVSPLAERLVGVVALTLAIVLFLPLPLGNIPPGIALSLMGIGLMERDGKLVAYGLVAAILAMLIAIAVVMGALEIVLITLRSGLL